MPADRRSVSVVRCGDYRRESVDAAVRQAVDLIGGIGAFVSPGETVLVKPNMLQGAAPGRCVATHPEVVFAVAKLLAAHGCRVVIADSPGAGIVYSEGNLRRAYAACGYAAVADELGVDLNLDTDARDVPFPEGEVMKRFSIIAPALEADAVVVVSKAKTHTWTRMSGAAKNLFGLIPGFEKPAFHFRFQDEADFGRMLVDLNELIRPRLQVMDAVIGMEGDGPQSGAPRQIGAILAGGSATAVDVVLARLIGYEPMEIGTIRAAAERGLVDPAAVATVGISPEEIAVPDFKKPSTYIRGGEGIWRRARQAVVRRFGRAYALSPRVVPESCIGCGKCERICPVHAVRMQNGRAVINRADCIRCYCCHEMCTEGAIRLERSRLGRLLAGLLG
ncbi:DUF362 domain-containing protein [Methanoculleus sp. FWC-SCC1]|uniref:DUF362 domain-containing protein n=1 Tax=Methanoculleus frigidifontis TaxID=2584085 RepID=A0ABT8M9M9_9EURY|nr:DUF362 domain-containing protein [Methanoculleus sp. FWC-SCC1]MDN7024601.1 DUF362 domain-containing protein [Methanoculleus sp. FWC-SCC1]